ncbi:Very-long-chain aldehyde decarbonylase CER1, partial [Cucurbita argyrosperma subsp. sororia]
MLCIKNLSQRKDVADVVHLTSLTTPESIFIYVLGSAALAIPDLSQPRVICGCCHQSQSLCVDLWPSFCVESNQFEKLKMQTWVTPSLTIRQGRFALLQNWLPRRLMVHGANSGCGAMRLKGDPARVCLCNVRYRASPGNNASTWVFSL